MSSRLNRYVAQVDNTPLPDLEEDFIKAGFKDHRNIESYINLAAVTPPEFRDNIMQYAKSIDDQIAEEEGVTQFADLYEAIAHAWDYAKGGKVSIFAIAEIYNDGKPEQEILSNRTIGGLVNILGLRKKCRMTGGRVGRYISERTMKRLKRRYGSSQTTIEDAIDTNTHTPQGASLSSLPSLNTDEKASSEPEKEVDNNLIKDAVGILRSKEDSMEQVELWKVLMGLGYNQAQVSPLLRECPRFRFQGTLVKLVMSKEEEKTDE